MAGYWHGDSIAVMLLLHRLRRSGCPPVAAAVTADARGDIIEGLLADCGGRAVRLQDGAGIRHALAPLREQLGDSGSVFAVALDGPLGPLHQPKRFLFRLAQGAGRPVVAVRVRYSAAVRLHRRWDRYAIPLPLSRVEVFVDEIGLVTKSMLGQFETLSAELTARAEFRSDLPAGPVRDTEIVV